MLDLIMVAAGLAFFAVAGGYGAACDRLCGGRLMVLDYALGSLVTLGLLVYLTYALLRPERF